MDTYWLIPIALLTSTLSGATGLGGGVVLISIMAAFFPPTVLIPLHGSIQFASNLSRCAFSFSAINRRIIKHYTFGAIAGAAIGSQIVVELPERLLWFTLGIFILLLTWLPLKKLLARLHWKFPVVGAVSTFLSLFIGITGPLLHPIILRENLEKHAFIGTEAACAGITHLLKVIVFSALGFAALTHWKLLLPMVAASIAGSYLGKKLLGRIPQQRFEQIVRAIVTILALRMLVKAML